MSTAACTSRYAHAPPARCATAGQQTAHTMHPGGPPCAPALPLHMSNEKKREPALACSASGPAHPASYHVPLPRRTTPLLQSHPIPDHAGSHAHRHATPMHSSPGLNSSRSSAEGSTGTGHGRPSLPATSGQRQQHPHQHKQAKGGNTGLQHPAHPPLPSNPPLEQASDAPWQGMQHRRKDRRWGTT